MTQEQLTQLTRIFNTLLGISTNGEGTLLMSDCIRALQEIINEENKSKQGTSEQNNNVDAEG
jgi:hypothetical protein